MQNLFKCRLAAKGWENFTGSLGHGAVFKNGVSVDVLTARQIARIGSSTKLVNNETGQQVGPSVIHNLIQAEKMVPSTPLKNVEQENVDHEFDRQQLAAEEKDRKNAEAAALKEAQEKAQKQIDDAVVYTRAELEAIGANDGIGGLREIANPLGVKGRGIAELVTEILTAQAKLAVG